MVSTMLGALRPPTGYNGSRGISSRPPSSMRGGTASRLTAAASSLSSGSTTSQRIGTAIGNAGNMITDRPITQHGLSGLPTGQGRIGTAATQGMRQIKDKRYWLAHLQMKINDITKEIEKLATEREAMDREKSAQRNFGRKVKEAANDLTNLQIQLTDMNIVLDSHSTGLSRQQLQQETVAIRERNEHLQNEVEILFNDKQIKTERNNELEQSITKEKNKINEMVFALSTDDQRKYHELVGLSEELRSFNGEMRNEIEQIIHQKDMLQSTISSSHSRTEAIRLLIKLNEQVGKRNSLREDEANRLSPAQEREKLISEVRANNHSLASINNQIKLIEQQLNDKREVLRQHNEDLEEGNSERHAKYKELKRRDETMSKFMAEFSENMEQEQRNILLLKNQITYAIEQITLQGINLKSYGIINKSSMDEKNNLKSHDGLLKEYNRLSIQLKQLQILEKKTRQQLEELNKEKDVIIEEIMKFNNLSILRNDAATKMEELTGQLEDAKKKKHTTEGVVQDANTRNAELKEKLRLNETFRQISHFEEKLSDLLKENSRLQESLDEIKKEFNYQEIKDRALKDLNELMELLRTETP